MKKVLDIQGLTKRYKNGRGVGDISFSIGEGEEALCELAELIRACKKEGVSREELLYRASRLEGFYVPSLYNVTYNEDGTLASFTPRREGVPATVRKRIIADMDKVYFPEKSPMPYLDVVHDRVMMEVTRGCIRGCRFCQAGMIYRPYRDKSPEGINACAMASIGHTGYSEISLTSLSISDYPRLPELVDKLLAWTEEQKVGLSLPSQRIDAFYEELAQAIVLLPDKYKEVILLHYYQNMNVREIAQTLGLVPSSVSNRLIKAHARLKSLLERRDFHG